MWDDDGDPVRRYINAHYERDQDSIPDHVRTIKLIYEVRFPALMGTVGAFFVLLVSGFYGSIDQADVLTAFFTFGGVTAWFFKHGGYLDSSLDHP